MLVRRHFKDHDLQTSSPRHAGLVVNTSTDNSYGAWQCGAV
jgi:hypothetical protein